MIVMEKDELAALIEQTIGEALSQHHFDAPQPVAQFDKPYLTKEELKKLTGWSDRKMQYLRDARKIDFVKENDTSPIIYVTKSIKKYLHDHTYPARK